MADIVSFPVVSVPEPEKILLCGCGCETFRVLVHGEIECSNCFGRMSDDVTAYERVSVVDAPAEPLSVHGLGTDDLALRQILRDARPDVAAAVIVMCIDGRMRAWSQGADGAEQEAWFRDRIDGLLDLVK